MNIARHGRARMLLSLLLLPALGWSQQLPDPELREVLRAAASAADSFDDRFHAEVWLTDMSRRLARQVRNPDERMRILTRVHYEASLVDLAPELVLAVIDVESNFDPYAVSHRGCSRAHAGHALLAQGNRPAR